MKTIALTGGGTAGHVTPALALLPDLKKHFEKIIFIGGNGMEKEIVKKYNIPFFSVKNAKLDRRDFLKNLLIPTHVIKGIKESEKILKDNDVIAVFGKGGYASIPACLAAKRLNIPVIIHESDYTLGLANKLISRFAKATITSFAETKNGVYIGNPVRKEILHGSKIRAMQKYGIDPQKTVLLVMGGSSGAEAINEVIYKGIIPLTERYTVVHLTGKTPSPVVREGYYPITYAHDIADLYALSDLVVSRGGANSLSELASLGKKCLIIPLPKGASRGDQVDNALSYKKAGYAEVLLQEDLFVESLIAGLDAIKNKTFIKKDVSQVNEKIAKVILKYCDLVE